MRMKQILVKILDFSDEIKKMIMIMRNKWVNSNLRELLKLNSKKYIGFILIL